MNFLPPILAFTTLYLFLLPAPSRLLNDDRSRQVTSAYTAVQVNNSHPSIDLDAAGAMLYRNLARQAFMYLNEFRRDPAGHGRQIGLDLSQVSPRRQLQWDPILAAAAEEKVYDMGHENFFGHIDPQGYGMNYRVAQKGYLLPPAWTENPAANFIESIAANSMDPAHFIDQLIIDKGIPGKGHRQHLLGTSNFYSNASRIGIAIGYERNSTYKYYCCILIAPRFANVETPE